MPWGFDSPHPPRRTPLHTSVSTVRRIFCSDLRWLAGLTWARVGWTCALATAFALNQLPADVLEIYRRIDVPIVTYAYELLVMVPSKLIVWLSLMLLATIADNLPLRGTARKLGFALALILGLLTMPAVDYLSGPPYPDYPSWRYFLGQTTAAIFAIVIGVAWSAYRRDAAAAAALHQVALERGRLQRRMLDAGLKARQARVEPEFLLDSVTAIAASCAADADRAERMIDELVSYLRAALPDDGEEASTLGREVRMADAYLELMTLRTEGRVRGAVDVPAPLHTIKIAPALLSPLVASLVPHRRIAAGAGIDVRIEARPSGQNLRIEIVRRDIVNLRKGMTEGATPDPPGLADLRARLRDLYGDVASLTVDASAGGDTQAVLLLPRTPEPVDEPNEMPDQRAMALEMPFDPAYQGA